MLGQKQQPDSKPNSNVPQQYHDIVKSTCIYLILKLSDDLCTLFFASMTV